MENEQDDTDTVSSEASVQSVIADLQKKPLSDAINIVLRYLSSTKELFKVISTSPLFLHSFDANPHAALRDTLFKEVGEAVFQLILMEHALPSVNASETRDQIYNKFHVFFNKRGLVDTLGRFGHATAKAKFEDFMMGFNQSAERFCMVDVGSGKEAADAKVKGMFSLMTYRRL